MSAAAYVEEARGWAKAVTRAESRFPGDYGPAMDRVARKSGVPSGVIWRLHYRKPKSIATDHYAALGAYFANHEASYRTERSLRLDGSALGALLLRAADRLAGQEVGGLTYD